MLKKNNENGKKLTAADMKKISGGKLFCFAMDGSSCGGPACWEAGRERCCCAEL